MYRWAGLRTAGKRLFVVLLATMLLIEVALAAPYVKPTMADLYRSDLRWLALAVAAELLSMSAFARVQRRMLSAGGVRVAMRRLVALTYIANAVNFSLPGGAAWSAGYSFRRLRAWGASPPAAGFTVLASGLLSTLSFAVLAVACAVFAGGGGLGSLVMIGVAIPVAIATLLIRRRHHPDFLIRLAGRVLAPVNRVLRRAPDTGLGAARKTISELSAIEPRRRDWLAAFGFAELNWIADLICLVACCHAVGAGGTSLVLVTAAYLAGKTATTISLVPGGLGIVDAAMIFALTQGGVSTLSAAAAVLLYRLISVVLLVALGWLIWAITRADDSHRRRRAKAGDSPRPWAGCRGEHSQAEVS
jgi:uncharacterized protein (TIRG00374 family)